jgi:hypothetical protein
MSRIASTQSRSLLRVLFLRDCHLPSDANRTIVLPSSTALTVVGGIHDGNLVDAAKRKNVPCRRVGAPQMLSYLVPRGRRHASPSSASPPQLTPKLPQSLACRRLRVRNAQKRWARTSGLSGAVLEWTCSRGLVFEVDGQDTSVLAHRFDHIPTQVLRTGARELDHNDRSGTRAQQGQSIARLVAQERT